MIISKDVGAMSEISTRPKTTPKVKEKILQSAERLIERGGHQGTNTNAIIAGTWESLVAGC